MFPAQFDVPLVRSFRPDAKTPMLFPSGKPQGGAMGQTATYGREYYSKVARTEDDALKAAEREGKVPMTQQGTCSTWGRPGTVL